MGQTISVPAERMTARIIKELAAEALACRARLKEIEDEMMELLDRHPDANLIRGFPGMGTVLTAELIAEAGPFSRFRSADSLAAAAGVAPVLRQSGKFRFLRRPFGGNKALKRIFYQSAFCSLNHPDSRAFYNRKRQEGKRHHQALLALARRRVNVLWAMLRHRTSFQTNFKQAA
jgi:transposase